MSGMGLTPRQRELLIYIQERDVPPTFDEMERALGRKRSSISVTLKGLEERGYIRRRYGRWRSIEVLRRAPPRLRFLTLDQARAEAAAKLEAA